jgi:membrane metallo-endopeptidase-like protein 1
MFQACLNIGRINDLGLDPLVQLLASYGQWPMTVDDWSADSTDWRSLSASLTRTYSSGFVLDVFNYIDFLNDPDRNIIYVNFLFLKKLNYFFIC